jgi:hypothetical protein
VRGAVNDVPAGELSPGDDDPRRSETEPFGEGVVKQLQFPALVGNHREERLLFGHSVAIFYVRIVRVR